MKAPAYSRDLIARRNRDERISDCYIATGWPTKWLRHHVERSPFARNSALLATPEIVPYDWRLIVGLSVAVWWERDEHQARAEEIAIEIVKAHPLRCFTINPATGETRFHQLATDWRVAA